MPLADGNGGLYTAITLSYAGHARHRKSEGGRCLLKLAARAASCTPARHKGAATARDCPWLVSQATMPLDRSS